MVRAYGLIFASIFACASALGQTVPSARERFDHGVSLAERGEFDAAAVEFAEAYRMSPNFAVLYNLGLAYASLGKPIEAVQAFEGYLDKGGPSLTTPRRDQVRELILQSKRRFGYVSFEVDTPGVEVSVDGRALGTSPLRSAFPLSVGTHGVTAVLAGRMPFVGSVEIEPQRTAPLAIALAPVATTVKTEVIQAKLGQLAVQCLVPAVKVAVDGSIVDASSGPLLVAPGRHLVTCERTGYAPFNATVAVRDAGVAQVTCVLAPLAGLPGSETGFLSLDISEPGAEVWTDGHRSSATARLPSGPHAVRVHRWGFVDWQQTVAVTADFPRTIEVRLRPTPEHVLELSRANSSARSWAYVIGGTGLALLGTSAALYVDNNQRYRSWQQARDALSRDLQRQQDAAHWNERTNVLTRTAGTIQRQDDIALAGLLTGSTLLTYAIVSWVEAR